MYRLDRKWSLWCSSCHVIIDILQVSLLFEHRMAYGTCVKCISVERFNVGQRSYTMFQHKWNSQYLHSDHWTSVPTISGHYGAVQDLTWEPTRGEFLLSVSADQTTRAHAPWVREGKEVTWREVARPQIHGYDMKCIRMITPVLFVSGADEKVKAKLCLSSNWHCMLSFHFVASSCIS